MADEIGPPDPVPAGKVPLTHCIGYLAARFGDNRLVQPISLFEHEETGELRWDPPPSEIKGAIEAYSGMTLLALRAGYLTAFVGESGQILPPDFWQWSEALECLRTGSWRNTRLLVDRDELRRLGDDVLAQDGKSGNGEDPEQTADGASAIYRTGAPGRPTSVALLRKELARLAAAGRTWPTKDACSKELSAWLAKEHPEAPPMTQKTILNKLRCMMPIARNYARK